MVNDTLEAEKIYDFDNFGIALINIVYEIRCPIFCLSALSALINSRVKTPSDAIWREPHAARRTWDARPVWQKPGA